MKITEFMSTYRCKGYGNLKHKLIENIVTMQQNGGNKMPTNMVELLYRLPIARKRKKQSLQTEKAIEKTTDQTFQKRKTSLRTMNQR